MSGLNHDFILLSRKENPVDEYFKFINNPKALLIHDDVLQYLGDTLEWIPSYNPSTKKPWKGLCWYGPTVIEQDGAEITRDVFRLWSELFKLGPIVLNLKGNHEFELENDPIKDGYERIVPNSSKYARIIINRNEIIDKFKIIVSYAEQIITSNNDLYILHIGI